MRWWKDTQGVFHQTSAAAATPRNNGTIAPLPSFTARSEDASATARQQEESNGTGDEPLATTPKIRPLQQQQQQHQQKQQQVAPPSTAASRETSVATESSSFSPKSGSKGRKKAHTHASRGGQGSARRSSSFALAHVKAILAASPAAAALDVAYVACTLALWITTVTYLASRERVELSTSTANTVYIAVNVIAQIFSIVWCLSRFFIQTRQGEWSIVDQVPDIARHYRKTWLPFDLFCVVPIEWICLGWATDYAFYLQLRQIVRVARFASLARSGNPLHERRQWMALLTYVAVVVALGSLCCV